MPRHQDNDVADYTLTIHALTEKAFLAENLEREKKWFPISQCTCEEGWDDISKGDTIKVTIPDWLADKNGLR